jgi:hypothetical protein
MERMRLVRVPMSELVVSAIEIALRNCADQTALNDVTDVKNNEFVYVY